MQNPSCLRAQQTVFHRRSGCRLTDWQHTHPGVAVAQLLVGALVGPTPLQLGLPLHAVGAHVELGDRQVHRVLVRACAPVFDPSQDGEQGQPPGRLRGSTLTLHPALKNNQLQQGMEMRNICSGVCGLYVADISTIVTLVPQGPETMLSRQKGGNSLSSCFFFCGLPPLAMAATPRHRRTCCGCSGGTAKARPPPQGCHSRLSRAAERHPARAAALLWARHGITLAPDLGTADATACRCSGAMLRLNAMRTPACKGLHTAHQALRNAGAVGCGACCQPSNARTSDRHG